MLETIVNNIEPYNDGIKLLEEHNYDAAKDYFDKRLIDNNYIVYYCLATSIFRKNPELLSKEDTLCIIDLYKKSISKKIDFADSYLMCAMAYEKLASILTREYKKNPFNKSIEKIFEIKSILNEAQKLIQISLQLNPYFETIARPEINAYANRLENLDYLQIYYEKNKGMIK